LLRDPGVRPINADPDSNGVHVSDFYTIHNVDDDTDLDRRSNSQFFMSTVDCDGNNDQNTFDLRYGGKDQHLHLDPDLYDGSCDGGFGFVRLALRSGHGGQAGLDGQLPNDGDAG